MLLTFLMLVGKIAKFSCEAAEAAVVDCCRDIESAQQQ